MKVLYPAYKIISDFFSTYSLPSAIEALSSSLKAANKEKIWKGRCPANLIYFYERLEGLLSAAYNLLDDFERREEAKLADINENIWLLTEYKIYCGWHTGDTPWYFFPRHLTQKEFIDPWKALKKITRYQTLEQWKLGFKDILQDALCTHSANEDTGILETWLLLHKLLEATHLIEVRVIIEDERGPRPKWKDKGNFSVNAQKEPEDSNAPPNTTIDN